MTDAVQIFLWGNLWIVLMALLFGKWLVSHVRSPDVWTYFIVLSLLPLFAAFLMPVNTVSVDWVVSLHSHVQSFGETTVSGSGGITVWMLVIWLYGVVASFKVVSLILRWVRLQLIALSKTELEGVFTTDADVPALALSWPKRCVVLPCKDVAATEKARNQIIAHERAHLKYYDPEITLLYLILQNLLWANPAMAWLITGWRDAAEMRADRVVTAGADISARKAYAQTLLSAMAKENGERAQQCPSAYLTSNSLRSVKMRLSEIMTTEPRGGNSLYKCLAIMGGLVMSLGGATFMAAAAPAAKMDSRPLKRVPPMMPASCPNLDMNTVEIKSYSSTIEGKDTHYRAANVGTVRLMFDVDKMGQTQNVKAVKSNHPCFETPAINAVAQWVYTADAPQKGVENMIKFRLSEGPEGSTSLEDDIKAFSVP